MPWIWREGRTLIALGAASLVMGAYLLLSGRPERDDDAADRLLPAPAPSLDRIVLHRRAGAPAAEIIVLTAEDREGRGGPFVEGPAGRLRADEELLAELREGLRQARIVRRLRGARADGTRHGLGEGTARLVVEIPGVRRLLFGDDAPGGLIYAARDAEPDVLIVERRLFDLLDGDWRRHARAQLTLGDLPGDARHVVLGGIKLVRAARSWLMTHAPGVMERARGERVEEALRLIGSERAARILGVAEGGRAGLDGEGRVIEIDGVRHALVRGACPAAENEVLVERADGARLCFTKEGLEKMLPSAERLFDERLVPFPIEEVRAVTLSGPGRAPLSLLRGGAQRWRVGDTDADTEAVADFLAALGRETLAGARADGPPPLPPPEIRMEIEAESGDRVALSLFAMGKRGIAVRRDDEPARGAAASLLVLARADRLRFLPRRLLGFPARDVIAVEVAGRDGMIEKIVRTRAPGPLGEGWVLEEPVAAPADVMRMTRLLGTLSDLGAERLIEPAAPGPPLVRVSVTVKTREGSARHVVERLDGRGEAGCVLRVAGAPHAGIFPNAACADLMPPFVTTSTLLLDDARLAGVRIQAGGREAVFAKGQKDLAAVLPALRDLERARPAGYGPGKGARAEVEIIVEMTPLRTTAVPLFGVAPERQVLLVYERERRLRVAGREVSYHVEEDVVRSLNRLARQPRE